MIKSRVLPILIQGQRINGKGKSKWISIRLSDELVHKSDIPIPIVPWRIPIHWSTLIFADSQFVFVRHQSQLVIATPSPILLACPNARIFLFSDDGIREVNYTDTEHYQVTKDFPSRHERMLQLLLSAEDDDLEAKRRKP